MNNVIISVSNKENIDSISKFLLNNNFFNIYSTGGTHTKILNDNPDNSSQIIKINDYTNIPEILDCLVKTLHPKIYGGLLFDLNIKTHTNQIKEHNIT